MHGERAVRVLERAPVAMGSVNDPLPRELRAALERFASSRDKIAVFDLDGTLLVGDIGDAVFAQLISEEKLPPESWTEYQELLSSDYSAGCQFAVRVMANLTTGQVIQATRQVIGSDEPWVTVPGTSVKAPVPTPDLRMQSLIGRLKEEGYDIYVVTATNVWTARQAVSAFFGLPEEHVLGMRAKTLTNRGGGEITSELQEPITVGEGKVLALKERIGNGHPLIAAGNSASDYALLRFVRAGGLVIWVGEDDARVRDLVGDTRQLIVLDQTPTHGGSQPWEKA